MESNKLAQALIIGAVVAVGGVGMFLFMFFVVLAEANSLARLLVSMLMPPLVMAIGFGAYYVFLTDRKRK